MGLDYLDFDYSEDDEGNGSFDAMATVDDARWPALEREVVQVLDWAEQLFPGSQGPLDAGGLWDWTLEATQEHATPLRVARDGDRLAVVPAGSGHSRTTLTLTLAGTRGFCEAFRDAFDVA